MANVTASATEVLSDNGPQAPTATQLSVSVHISKQQDRYALSISRQRHFAVYHLVEIWSTASQFHYRVMVHRASARWAAKGGHKVRRGRVRASVIGNETI